MNKFVHLSNTIEQLLLDVSKFTTSADVVMKASGLRFEAVRAIAREQGVEIEDQACSWNGAHNGECDENFHRVYIWLLTSSG